MSAAPRQPVRALLVVPAGLALLAGLDSGLTLLGVWSPVQAGHWGRVHGVLMVLGFLGTLVALERAVALGRPAGYLAPALLGSGALALLVPGAGSVARPLVVAGTAALCLAYLPLWRRQRDDAVLVSALGAVLALGGSLLWARGTDVASVVPWLAGFVILTIVGERLELARLGMPRGAGPALVAGAAALCLAVPSALLWPGVGSVLLGLAVLALAGWLVRHDVARHTVTRPGLPGFAGACLLAAQAWLAVAGLVWLVAGPVLEAGAYDAVVHAVFLGFAMSMVMAHAPTILPAVTRVRLPYRKVMYLPWLLLQVSLVVRLWGGDARGSEAALRVGGAGTVLAVAAFLAVAVGSALLAPAARRPLAGPGPLRGGVR